MAFSSKTEDFIDFIYGLNFMSLSTLEVLTATATGVMVIMHSSQTALF